MTLEQRRKRVSDETIERYYDEQEKLIILDEDTTASSDNIEEEVLRHDMEGILHNLMSMLKPIESDALKLFYFENKTLREIGETLWPSPDKRKCYDRGKGLVEKALCHLRKHIYSREEGRLFDYREQ